jgi:hypothetical protein
MVISYQLSAISYQLSAISAAGLKPTPYSAIGYQISAIGYQLSAPGVFGLAFKRAISWKSTVPKAES